MTPSHKNSAAGASSYLSAFITYYVFVIASGLHRLAIGSMPTWPDGGMIRVDEAARVVDRRSIDRSIDEVVLVEGG